MAQALEQDRRVQPTKEGDAEQICAMISVAQTIPDCEERFRFLAAPFVETGTPYFREMRLPDLSPGLVRVDLSSFDCSSFVYFLTAMSYARDMDTFLLALTTIRYRNGCASPNNLIHFASNGMTQIIDAQIAVDLTEELAAPDAMRTRAVNLGVKGDGRPVYQLHDRPEFWEGNGHLISGDDNLGQLVTLRYIHRSAVAEVEPLLKCGDILFLASSQDPQQYPELITHGGFAYKFDDCPEKAFFLHCSLTEWSVVRAKRGGVCIARFPDWTREAASSISRYCQLHEYFEAYKKHFDGLVVLRPVVRLMQS